MADFTTPGIAGRAANIDDNCSVANTALNASITVHEFVVEGQELQPYSRAFEVSVLIAAVAVVVLAVGCFR